MLGSAPPTVKRTGHGLQLRGPVLGVPQQHVLDSPAAEVWADDPAGVNGLLGGIRPQVFGLALTFGAGSHRPNQPGEPGAHPLT